MTAQWILSRESHDDSLELSLSGNFGCRVKNFPLSFLFFIFFFKVAYFYSVLWVFACMRICVPRTRLMFLKVRRGHQMTQDQSYRCLWDAMWGLGTKSGSSARTVSVVNLKAIALIPNLFNIKSLALPLSRYHLLLYNKVIRAQGYLCYQM